MWGSYGTRRRLDMTGVWAVLFTLALFACIVVMYIGIERTRRDAYVAVYGDATPDLAAAATSLGIGLYDGGDGRTTTGIIWLPAATTFETEKPSGMLDSPDEAVNYIYDTRRQRDILVRVRGRGNTEPVVTVFSPNGSVLASNDNPAGERTVTLNASLPTRGYYTIRVAAKAVGAPTLTSTMINYELDLETPGVISVVEVPKLWPAVPVVIIWALGVLALVGKLRRRPFTKVEDALRNLYVMAAGVDQPELPPPSRPQTVLVQRSPPAVRPYYSEGARPACPTCGCLLGVADVPAEPGPALPRHCFVCTNPECPRYLQIELENPWLNVDSDPTNLHPEDPQ